MENPFSRPSSNVKIIAEENIGRLFMITPLSVEKDVPTVLGSTDALLADVVILDESGAGKHQEYPNSFLFQRVLIGSLRGSIGKDMPVLGVLGRGEASEGKSKPWVIKPPSQAQIDIGLRYWDSKQKNPFAMAS